MIRRTFLSVLGYLPFVRLKTEPSVVAACDGYDSDMFFPQARRTMCSAMQSDEGLRIAYQANIAMRIYDNSPANHEEANRLADEIMNLLFEVPLQCR